ncbi:MAG: tetratricopeptide repeat protein, partial [Nodosilinea sp.]
MVLIQPMASGVLAMLLAVGSGSVGAAPDVVPRVAQVAPNSVTGQLDETSDTLEDGSYYAVHTFEGTAGDIVAINLASEDFDAYLILVGPDGETVAENDDGEGTNSLLVVQLPATGRYQVLANTYEAGAVGAYSLGWRSATAAEAAEAEVLQRAERLNQQATELYEAGRYDEAEPFLQEALQIRQTALGPDHPDVATSLNNLAELYRLQGRYGESEPLHQEALSIRRQQLGDRHPAVATSLSNLALLHLDQGRYEEAEPLHQESLAIRRERLGDRHPDIATSLNNLAGLYQ